MVNVNKNIVPGKKAESSAKTEPQAPARRPRNQELNSSKKPLSGKISTAARNPFLRKLNSSRLAGSTFDGKTYDEARNILMADEYGYDMLWDYFSEYMPKLGEEVGKQVDMQFGDTADVFFNTMAECSTEEEFIKKIQEQLQKYSDLSVDSSCGDKADVDSSKELNCAENSNSIREVVNTAITQVDLPKGYRYTNSRLIDNGIVVTLMYSDASGNSTWVEKIMVSEDNGQWFCSQYEPGHFSNESFHEMSDNIDTAEEAIAWVTEALTEAARYYAENPPRRVSRSNEKSDVDSSKKLNCADVTEDDFEYEEDGSGISTKDYMGYTIYKSIPDEDSGSVGYMVYDGDYPQSFDTLEECKEFIRDTLNSSKKLNCAADSETKITTESGNEVSISDIQIIQNPDTNELSLFIKEDEDEEIPEGFVVIATATQAALPTGDTCPDCGQEPCVCEDEGELDSSKKKN